MIAFALTVFVSLLVESQAQTVQPLTVRPRKFSTTKTVRQSACVDAVRRAFTGYRKYAWGHDNLKPISMTFTDPYSLAFTILDMMDTLLIMNMRTEYTLCLNYVRTTLTFDVNRDDSVFEVTIRALGGLLSAYYFTGEQVFLTKAIDLGNRLLPAFNTPTGIPYPTVNMRTGNRRPLGWASPDYCVIAEATTLQLEMRTLSRFSGDPKYEIAGNRVNDAVHNAYKKLGLVNVFINRVTGQFVEDSTVTVGGMADSYYEYLLKQWLQTGRKNDSLKADYIAAVDGINQRLVSHTVNERWTFLSQYVANRTLSNNMDHLACFLGGTLVLGSHYGMPDYHHDLGVELCETCYQMYLAMPTQLAPEIANFNTNPTVQTDIVAANRQNNLRPEMIETLYYLYVITGDTKYQDWGWLIFNAFNNYTRVSNGYSSINDVTKTTNVQPLDMMETFWLAETLKYFYLLFSDNRDLIDLDEMVFNTEAHPLPMLGK